MEFFTDSLYVQKTSNSSGFNPYIDTVEKYKVALKLSPSEIQTVRSSWSQMQNDSINQTSDEEEEDELKGFATNSKSKGSFSSLFCHQFYTNLLGLDPNLEALFPSIKHQAASFAGVLQMAILHLEDLSALDDYLDGLGKRHSRVLGIEPPQFDLMGAALIKTFSDRFGSKFTAQIEDVWIKVYSYLANTILQNGAEDVMKVHEDPFFDFGLEYDTRSTSAVSSASSYNHQGDSVSIASSLTSANDEADYLPVKKSSNFFDISNSNGNNDSNPSQYRYGPLVANGNNPNSNPRSNGRFTTRKSSNRNLKNVTISPVNASNNAMPRSPSNQVFADLVVPGINPNSPSGSTNSSSTITGSGKTEATKNNEPAPSGNAEKLSVKASRFANLKNVMRLEKSKRVSTLY